MIPKITAIGIGGGGCYSAAQLFERAVPNTKYVAIDTDVKALDSSIVPIKILLGKEFPNGVETWGNPTVGRMVTERAEGEIREITKCTDLVFLLAAMGGGTGTGSIPLIAEIAKQSGALTIAIVSRPFTFEGVNRTRIADEGIQCLLGKVDSLIVVSKDPLLYLRDVSLRKYALYYGASTISELITVPGLINLDFNDVKNTMYRAGLVWMSVGIGSGRNRAVDAAWDALVNPFLNMTPAGARVTLFNVVGGSTLRLSEVNKAAEVIKAEVDPEANIIFGVTHAPGMDEEVRITLIATDLPRNSRISTGK